MEEYLRNNSQPIPIPSSRRESEYLSAVISKLNSDAKLALEREKLVASKELEIGRQIATKELEIGKQVAAKELERVKLINIFGSVVFATAGFVFAAFVVADKVNLGGIGIDIQGIAKACREFVDMLAGRSLLSLILPPIFSRGAGKLNSSDPPVPLDGEQKPFAKAPTSTFTAVPKSQVRCKPSLF